MHGWMSTGWTHGRTDRQTHRGAAPGPGTDPLQRGRGLPCAAEIPAPGELNGLFPVPPGPAAAGPPPTRSGLSGHFAQLPQRQSPARRGQELRETTSFQQVNHPRGKRRDHSYAGTAHKVRAGILEKLPLIQIVRLLGMWCW